MEPINASGMTSSKILLKYCLFAAVATAMNLLAQYLSFAIYQGSYDIFIAIFIGTGVGLVTKYILDKNFIFYHRVENTSEQAKNFVLYTFTGVFTTVIFWGIELLFNILLDFDAAKYIGAIVGLSIGYVCKYYLDKSFVFSNRSDARNVA